LSPRCDDCKKTIKPDVILFGDPLPASVYQEATDLVMNCTLLLILGFPLVVHPVAALPGLALKNGAKISSTFSRLPYDRYAHVVVYRPLGEFCQEILDRIENL
jgi:NAD-dependent deacetylase